MNNKFPQFIENEFGYCFYIFGRAFNIGNESEEIYGIYNLFVYPEFRRCGKAQELLQLVIDAIRKTGYIDEIRIEADPKENSISFEDLVSFYTRMKLTIYNKLIEQENPMNKPDLNKPAFTSGIWPEAKEAVVAEKCPMCLAEIKEEDFKDALSKKEYSISGMCQNCQDSVFGG